jgi:phage shock protein C
MRMNQRLYRSPDDRILAGVAGGIAEAWDFDPALVRVGWALLILATGGVFLLLYIVMALVVPLRPYPRMQWSAATAMGPDGSPPTPPPGPETPNMPGPPPAGMPPHGYGSRYRQPRRESTAPLVIGLLLILAGGFFLARQLIPQLNFSLIWPVVVIGLGGLLIIAAFIPRGKAQ